ncbi:MAG: ABC-2 family transporter protein [Oscillospiraceae bacterium]|nr:ABC-2 family transporter protein [Oscillospiraceae bacterium]
MKRAFRLHRIFIAQYMKKLMEYKVDFIVGAVGFLLSQALEILFIGIIFSQIPDLAGWTFNEILFIYGFSLIPKAIDHMLFDNLWMVGYHIVRKGEFDKYLTRPINSLFYVTVEKFQIDAFGELIMGIILIAYSLIQIGADIVWYRVFVLLLLVPFAVLIFTAIKIITSAISFWTKQSGHITHMFYMSSDFSKYPVTIYNNFIKVVITYIIPFAFTAYYPASYFLRGENGLFCVLGTILVSSLLFVISILVWNRGIKKYESAGS